MAVVANETLVPLLPCVDPDATLAFWRSLGFEVTYEQHKPYLYLAFRWSSIDLHYGRAADGVDPAVENTGGALVMVDDVAAYHAEFVAAMRREHGKVLAKGLPRITRYRPGASRFTLMDPNGNQLIVIQRDEPAELEHGGSRELTGLAKAIDNARVLREFKNDDRAAWRALRSGLKRHTAAATTLDLATALAGLIELDIVLGEDVSEHAEQLAALELTATERDQVVGSVADGDLIRRHLPGS